jgi:hypothetical protein
MRDIFRVVAGRLTGAVVGALCGLAAGKGAGTLSPEAASEVTIVLTNSLMLAGYGIAHKLFDRKKAVAK